MFIENIKEKVLSDALKEEKAYNWVEAAKLYEKVAKSVQEAKYFDKLGDIYIRAIMASKTKEDYVYWSNQAIKAFYKAESLFNQTNDKLLAMECKAKALNARGYLITSIEEGRDDLKKSIEICLDLIKTYSNSGKNRNVVEVTILASQSIIFLLYVCKEPKDFEDYIELGCNLIEKAWKYSTLLEKIENLDLRTELLSFENALLIIDRYTGLTYGDKKEENIRKKFYTKCKETLELAEDYYDLLVLGRIYFIVGDFYCMYGSLYAKERVERLKQVEEGFYLIEEAVKIFRKTKDYFFLIYAIYSLDYLAGIFGRFEYYQKRIVKDVHELEKLSEVYDGFNTFHGLLISRLSLIYYHNFTSKSFYATDTRVSFARSGIKYAKKGLENLNFGPFFAQNYQILTQFYSQLALLAEEDDQQEEYIKKMFYYADQTGIHSKGFKGGTARSAGYESRYRANKTMADISNNKREKLYHLEIAIEAAKINLNYAIESYNLFLAAQIRLGLLYEELGILIADEKPLMEAREIYLHIIKETSETDFYYHYNAACYEFLARLEDRLGNNIVSSECYESAQNAHKKSLSTIEYKPLKSRIENKIKYAKAWSLIEKAKAFHKKEKHLEAKVEYENACVLLRELPENSFEASYFFSWSILERAEQFSKLEYFKNAIECYQSAKEKFKFARMAIRNVRKLEKRSKDLKKLEKAANVRMDYCSARVNLEKARILAKKGDHLDAAERFALAATQFSDICSHFKIKREKLELEAVYYLCKAWESLEIAEKFEDPNKYGISAELFSKASLLFVESKLKLLAKGNSHFCLALEQGCNFDKTHDIKIKTQLFLKVKSLLRNAAISYEKGGFKSGADWALATSTYFDATWHLIQADEELDINKRKGLLKIGSNYFKSAAELFGKSGYKDKEREVLERLNRVEKEEKILVSALNTIQKSNVSGSISGIITPSCPIEISQSPRIGEIQQYSEVASKFLEIDSRVQKYEIKYMDILKDHPKLPKNQCRVGIAQIGKSISGDIMSEFFEEKPKGLLTIKEEIIDHIKLKVKEMIEKAHANSIDILLFPEMTIDLKCKSFLEEITALAKKYQMYIIPGSYHNIESRSNISLFIGPEGILWEQEKHIPAIISLGNHRFKEGIDTNILPHKTIVCNTEFGRITIATCRDFLDMDLRVELKNFEPPVDIILNPAFTPVTADFKAVHFDARRSIYAYTFFANIAEYGNSLIYTPEKERIERNVPPKEEDLIFKDVDLFRLRSERKKWEAEQRKNKGFIQSTR
ncbi:MAG: carbon-nitrogen hydrolase family protein [Candidatus Thorarchaeota archaeon]